MGSGRALMAAVGVPGGDPLGLVPQLVALASDQTETRGRVTELAETVAELVDRVAGVLVDVEHVDGQLDTVRAAIEDLTAAVEGLSAEPDRAAVWSWADMDADARREALAELAGWVQDVLVSRYQLDERRLPRCWYRHPEAVEELSWLYADWARVFRGGRGASTSAAGEWHDRWLPGVLDRLGRSLAACAAGREHREYSLPLRPAVDPGFDAYIATHDRPSATASPD